MIRIAIVDDHELVRRGLKDLIESDQQLQVVAQAGNAFDGFQQIRNLKPEIAILDVRLLDGNGVELCREIQSCVPGVKVIMLTAFADDEALLGAILAGASGYLLKDIKGDVFLKSIHAVAQGRSILDKNAADRVKERLRKSGSPAADISNLSDQEKKIIVLIGEGLTNRQIAEQMFIAEKTVKNYVSSLLSKLSLERRTQAASLVTRIGMRPDSQRDFPTDFHSWS
jgi:two-component system response regulator DevR